MSENGGTFLVGPLYLPYFLELAGATNALPGQENVMAELEHLRTRLADVLSKISSADRKKLWVLYDQLAGELLTAGGKVLPIRYMSRAAAWLAAAAEADKKAATSASLRNFKQLSKIVRNSAQRESYENVLRFSQQANTQSDWLAAWIGGFIRADARTTASAVRKALRRARFLAWVRWIVPRAAYFFWSFIFLTVVLDLFMDFGKNELVHLFKPLSDLLAPYIGDAARQSERIIKFILLLVVAWFLVERFKPYLERWQARLETHQVKKFASDVLNASFQIRICEALVQIAFFDAKSFAFSKEPRAWVKLFLNNWSIPRIDRLEGLVPLTSLEAASEPG
jgi:hypothetical protein